MSPPKQERLRAKKPKTRTGCKTCKSRKVKCDEGRPACSRCLKFGVVCEGYDLVMNYSKITLKKILPRTSSCLAILAPSQTGLHLTNKYQDHREYQYFLHFQEETALEISGAFETSLWNHVILQACQNEPTLRRLTASIGALSKASRLQALNQDEEAKLHQQHALQKYGRALKEIQKVISTSRCQDSARIALITSLLVYCFEILHGDLESAFKHMRSALQVMGKQLAHASRHYKHLKNTSPTPALEDALVVTFVRLDNALLSKIDNSSLKAIGPYVVKPSILDIKYSEETYNVPYRFRNINEARIYLEHFQFQALPSLAHELGIQIVGASEIVNEAVRDIYTAMSSQLRQWKAAFAPLYAQACTSTGRKDFLAAVMLRVQALSTELAAKRVCARGTSPPDHFIAEAREIIDLSKLVAADPSFRRVFVFDCGIVPGLFIVVCACLDMDLRKEALQVLRRTVPRQEGAWDSVTLVKAGEGLLQLGPLERRNS